MIALSATIFSLWSLSIVFTKLLAIPLVVSRLAPASADIREMPPLKIDTVQPNQELADSPVTPSGRMENSRIVTMSLALLGAFYIALHFQQGGSINLNTINMIFLTGIRYPSGLFSALVC